MPLVRKPAGPVLPSPTSTTVVRAGLRDPNADQRWAAARAAAELPEMAPELAAALSIESDARVREVMFTSLTRMGPAQISAHIVPLLRSAQAALRTGALDALRLSFNTMPGLLPGLLQDPDADVRLLSCELARSLPSAEATRRLCVLLADEQNVNVCAAAVEVLSEVGTPEALPVLAQVGQRFAQDPFLPFAIKVATDRLAWKSAGERD